MHIPALGGSNRRLEDNDRSSSSRGRKTALSGDEAEYDPSSEQRIGEGGTRPAETQQRKLQ